MRQFTMASYKHTRLGQLQQILNAVTQKIRRKKDKVTKLLTAVQKFTDKAAAEELTDVDKVKLTRLQTELKQAKADISSLNEELKNIKSLKDDKKKEQKQKDEIFAAETGGDANTSKNNEDADNAFLASLYGVPTTPNEGVVDFANM